MARHIVRADVHLLPDIRPSFLLFFFITFKANSVEIDVARHNLTLIVVGGTCGPSAAFVATFDINPFESFRGTFFVIKYHIKSPLINANLSSLLPANICRLSI
jgi:hypothetical protein